MRNRMRPVRIPVGRLVLSRPTRGAIVWGWPRKTTTNWVKVELMCELNERCTHIWTSWEFESQWTARELNSRVNQMRVALIYVNFMRVWLTVNCTRVELMCELDESCTHMWNSSELNSHVNCMRVVLTCELDERWVRQCRVIMSHHQTSVVTGVFLLRVTNIQLLISRF